TKKGGHVPHLVYVPLHPPAHPRLAVFFPGTDARPSYYTPLVEALAQQGWFVIDLRYTTSVATENACPNAGYKTNPECYRQFRAESVFGENVPDPTGHAYNYVGTQVDKVNSVMNRLLKLVGYLSAHPSLAGAGWSRFLAMRDGKCSSYNATYGACNLDWSRLALGGHSQGAGVALYLSKFYKVARVAMLSGPEDAYVFPGRTVAAPWINQGRFATPVDADYGFTHVNDPFYQRQTAAWAALGLPGAVMHYAPNQPMKTSHRIVTSIAPACPLLGAILAAHSATSVVGCVDLPGYATVWNTMFGAP
ncbi:MAG: BPSS1187 family protein, partial [Chloroflexota bacterium]